MTMKPVSPPAESMKLMIFTIPGCVISARNSRSAWTTAMSMSFGSAIMPLSTTQRSDTLWSLAR